MRPALSRRELVINGAFSVPTTPWTRQTRSPGSGDLDGELVQEREDGLNAPVDRGLLGVPLGAEDMEVLGALILILAIAIYRGRTQQRFVWHMDGKCTRRRLPIRVKQSSQPVSGIPLRSAIWAELRTRTIRPAPAIQAGYPRRRPSNCHGDGGG
jgi:hypothetical protein